MANAAYDIANVYREEQSFLSFNFAGSRLISGRVYKEKIQFKDILNVMPGSSVKTLGAMIGLEKIEVDGEFDNEYYCQRDTEIVYWARLSFKKVLDSINVEMRNTAAGIGFNALLDRFPKLKYNDFTYDDHEFFRQGYYGGRTEVFNTSELKGKDIYYYDIRSAYPSVMRDIPLVNTYSMFSPKKLMLDYEGMSDVTVEAPSDLYIPYLPFRTKTKLIFPIGEFRGVWTHFELREAIKLGYKIIKYHEGRAFSRTLGFTLREFIEELYALREEAKLLGNQVIAYVVKIILNGCYGKFAMGNENTRMMTIAEEHELEGDYSSELFPNGQFLVKQITEYMPSTNFYTAARITAGTRHELYKPLSEAHALKNVLIYCDTDSIVTKGKKLTEKPGLGGLGLEYQGEKCHFKLPKTYMFKPVGRPAIYRCKGVKNNLAKQYFTKGYAKSMQPLKYVETCRKNFFIEERNKKSIKKEKFIPFNLWVDKPKQMRSKYDKRQILKNGDTRPFRILENENGQ